MNVRNILLLLICCVCLAAQPVAAEEGGAETDRTAPAGNNVILLDVEEVEPAIVVGEQDELILPGRPHRVQFAQPGGARILFVEGPGDDGAPRKRLIVQGAPNAAGNVLYKLAEPQMKKMTHLGVSTSPVLPQVAAQLKLSEGFGLSVDAVEAGSPAAEAGLQLHDVLVKFGDQKLVNMAQLGTLVRAQKPGETVELTVIREGKEQVLKAKLIEKEKPVLPEGGLRWTPAAPGQMQLLPGARLGEPLGVEGIPFHPANRGMKILKFADDEHQLELRIDDKGKTLTVHDKAGKEIFQGPINTDEERAKLPDAIKAKLQKLEKSADSRRLMLPGAGAGNVEFEFNLDGDRLGELIQQHMKEMPKAGLDRESMQQRIELMQKQIQELMQEHMKELHQRGAAGGEGAAAGPDSRHFQLQLGAGASVATLNDGTYTLTVKSHEGDKHLTVQDREGKTLFDGPINTDEERAKVPQEVRGKLKMLESNRIEIRRRAVPAPQAEPAPNKGADPGPRERDAEFNPI